MDHMVIGAGKLNPGLGDETEFDNDANLSLSDRLKPFKSSQFDADSFINSKCHNMAEKELKYLTVYLKDLQKASAEEMRKSVYANYAAFIRTAKEISALEGQLLSLRNFLSAQAIVIHGLADGVHVNSLSPGLQGPSDDEASNKKSSKVIKIETWLTEFLETLEVLLAERRIEEALAALDEGERVVKDANDRGALIPSMLLSLQNAITKSRLKLADQLIQTASQSSTKGAELRTVVLALKRLGDGPRAHTLLLKAHRKKLNLKMQNLTPVGGGGGGVYCTSLSKLVFSTIAQASSDSLTVFGEDTSYTSELVTWAVMRTEEFGLTVMKQSLYSSAASGKLRAAVECVHGCLGHCVLLEARGMALSPVLLKHFKPLIEQTLNANLRRIEQNIAALAASDDWSLVLPPGVVVLAAVSSLPKLSKSAHRFNSMVQDLFEGVEPLDTLQLMTPLLEGVVQVFNSYVTMLTHAFPVSVSEASQEGVTISIVREAVTEAQQLALLANALILSDDYIPRAAAKFLSFNQRNSLEESSRRDVERQNRVVEQRDWKKRLQKSVDRLRDSFCRQHALEIIFSEDGEVRLTAHLYTAMDGYSEEPEWFPSSIFQELFMKLTHIATLAADMFVGRERFASLLLMRLTETVILYLSDDQTFWEEIEQGQKPLGPYGLQQFYLDMEFMILFASQGRFLSRSLQQVAKDIIARAIDAVSATGIDPYSTLPEDEWFAEVAQLAVKMLSGNGTFESDDRDTTVVSPTASMSAKSIS